VCMCLHVSRAERVCACICTYLVCTCVCTYSGLSVCLSLLALIKIVAHVLCICLHVCVYLRVFARTESQECFSMCTFTAESVAACV
jgi:hypothetical protein